MDLRLFFDIQENDYEVEKNRFLKHMDFLRSLSNEELTLYKKWSEVQSYSKMLDKSSVLKANIWRPTNILDRTSTIQEIQNLEPEILFIRPADKSLVEDWSILRVFISTMEFDQNPGRFIRFLVRDKVTKKYLGITSLGSDVVAITCRDKWIGWDTETRIKKGMIRHSAIATTVVPTQPLGYNMLGGKLIASLLCTDVVRNAWKELYDEVLVGVTTTSLYGKHSMYQRIPYWKELGETTGRVTLKPADSYYKFWHHWIQEHYPEKYAEKTLGAGNGPATGVKQKILVMIMKELGMKQSTYIHGFSRGVYYAPFFENTKEFLCKKISESELVPSKKLEGGYDAIVGWWKDKAIRRYENLFDQNRINPETLFYNRAIGMSWDEMKKNYAEEVGR